MANYGSRRGNTGSGRQSRQNQGHKTRGRAGRGAVRGRDIERENDQDYETRSRRSTGRRGFVPMEEEEQRETTVMRGRTSRKNVKRGSGRGFASMNEEQQKEIASMGGRAAHEYGTAHEFTPEEAQVAGRRGGERTRRTHGREFYQEIGRIGGEERRKELGPEGYSELGRMGGRSRWEDSRTTRQGVRGRSISSRNGRRTVTRATRAKSRSKNY